MLVATPAASHPLPAAAKCPIFPRSNPWNRRVDRGDRHALIVDRWYISGAPDSRWSNDQLHTLGRVEASAFEVVDTPKLRP